MSEAMSSDQLPTKETVQPRFEAVIACGMGPMELKPSRDPKRNPVPTNVFNFFNAVAAKILVTKGWASEGILSGYKSRQTAREGIREDVALEELVRSEGGVLAHIYDQTRPKKVAKEAVDQAETFMTIDEKAKTTFGNILEGLNLLDAKDSKGHFDGSFGVVSPEFHGPRIAEMFKAFGLTNGRFISAEGVLGAAGYTGGIRGFGPTYDMYNNGAYPGQPVGLQNLQDNPSYVTRDLAVIKSSKRFHEVASALRDYYTNRPEPVVLPECFQAIPTAFNSAFDYEGLKQKFAAIPFAKHGYMGDSTVAVESYKANARGLTNEVQQLLLTP